ARYNNHLGSINLDATCSQTTCSRGLRMHLSTSIQRKYGASNTRQEHPKRRESSSIIQVRSSSKNSMRTSVKSLFDGMLNRSMTGVELSVLTGAIPEASISNHNP